MFDIGWSELLIVLIVALVVVGPKDLPRLMRMAGQWMGKARNMADQFRKSFDEMSRQAELDELRKEINSLRSQRPLADLDQSVLPPDDVMRGKPLEPGGAMDEDAAPDAGPAPHDAPDGQEEKESAAEPNFKPGDKPPAP